MPIYIMINEVAGIQAEIDFGTFINVVKGMSITSAASSDDMKFVELGLSENFNLRIESGENEDVVVMLRSMLNTDDVPPLRIQILPDEEKQTTAEAVEKRIGLLRQIYAIGLLVNTDRTPELTALLKKDPYADIEATLLKDEERLYIRAAGSGSFWLTILTKSKVGYKTAANLFSAFYDEGRELLLRRVRANTVLKELEVEERRFDIEKKKVAGIIEMVGKIDKIKDENMRRIVRERFIGDVRGLGSDTAAYLPPPSDTNGV